MNEDSGPNPYDLLFGGMDKLGPGDNRLTLAALESIPRKQFDLVVDAGCGSGRQTLVLADALRSTINAIDSHQSFLDTLMTRAKAAALESWIVPHCMDMSEIPDTFQKIDLLWCEGAAYSIGFENAVQSWKDAIRPEGFLVVSELCWIREPDKVRPETRSYFELGYPAMKHVENVISSCRSWGYSVQWHQTLEREAWTSGYYDELQIRAQNLIDHSDSLVRQMALEMLQEIEVFEKSDSSYSYVMLVLGAS